MFRLSKNKLSPIALALCLAVGTLPVLAQEQGDSDKDIEVVYIFGNEQALQTAPGSAFVVDAQDLEKYEFDDIHRVLQTVPGVYIREEDGYGLRPNIGLRGAIAERSSKIALMEDGVLIAPAPYAAPAAYYFPTVSRMSAVEVFKGPSAIAYGPNTVGGAVNLVSRPIGGDNLGNEFAGELDLAFGQQDYRKAHGFVTGEVEGIGFLVEAVNLHSDGFKTLPSGDDTGFAKNDLLGKFRYEVPNDPHNQVWNLKVGYADEVSNETYLGLTDSDFAADPYQRYAASNNDKLDWEHAQFQLSHYIELSPQSSLYTQVYRRDFNRDWDRLNGFTGNRSFATVLNSPDTGLNSLFVQVLKGERDSLTADETLVFTLNDRTYYSQGIETKYEWEGDWGSYDISIDAGVRLHQDQVERLHRARYFNMQQGQLQLSGLPDDILVNNKDEVTAISGYLNTKLVSGNLHTTIGLRVEDIDGDSSDYLAQTTDSNSDIVLLPGVGMFYQVTESLGLLAGITKGFVPNSPGQATGIDPEESWNYEFGVRASYDDMQLEAIGFYNDYSNLKGTCTFSSGCTTQLDQEFNGGEVEIYGAELALNTRVKLGAGLSLVPTLAYTFTESEFQNSFFSEFAQWGNVSAGDELPYLPEHQVNIGLSLEGGSWQVSLNAKSTSSMLEAAGSATELEGVETDSYSVFDLFGWYQFNPSLRFYAKLDNVSDEVEIVSRRPFGARPGKTRQASIGVKYAF